MSLMRHLNIGLLFVLIFEVSNALQFKPAPTEATILTNPAVGLASFPTVTAGPFHEEDLRKRQTNSQNAVCGWINGNAASQVSCPAEFYCATEQSFVGCCQTTSCVGIKTACYDILGSICDAACQHDVGNLICPSTLPYCGTFLYPGGSIGYGCRQETGYTVNVLLGTTTSDGGHLTLSTSSSSSSTPSSTSAASIAPTTPTPTPTQTSSTNKSGLGAGPIAGIVLGTIAVVGFIAALIFWMIMTHRKHRQPPQPEINQMQSQPHSPGQHYPSSGGFYGPPKESLQGTPPMNHTSPISVDGSEFSGRTTRNSQAAEYNGPLMPEMHGNHVYVPRRQ